MDTIRIFLVEDHQIVREGLRRMLELSPDIIVVGEASNGQEALQQVPQVAPDIVITDIKMPGMDGIELTRLLKKACPSCSVLVLTLYESYLASAVDAGASGYLLKDLRREVLVDAIRAVKDGRSPLHISLENGQLSSFVSGVSSRLTEREQNVLSLVAQGITIEQIASQLSFSNTTVKRIIRQTIEKLNVRNRSEAVARAIKENLI